MTLAAYAMYMNLRHGVGLVAKSLHASVANPITSATCNCAVLSRFNARSFSNIRNQKSRLLQNSNWFNRNSTHNANYYVKKKEQTTGLSWKIWATIGGVACVALVFPVFYFGQPNGDDDLYKNEPTPLGYIYRWRDLLHELRESIVEPSSDQLLPDPLPEPYIQPKYTLVLELKHVLVNPEYDRSSGWRMRKRPGVDQFLKALTFPLFEIVVYTHEQGPIAAPILDGLDSDGTIMYRLYRDSTKYMGGTHVKDLSKLNRDIRKVILLDCDEKTSKLQPRNSLVLKEWKGDPKDIDLLELIPLLHSIGMSNVDDVRPILDFYRGEEDVVTAFRRNQDALRQQQEEGLAAQQHQRSGGLLGGMIGRRS